VAAVALGVTHAPDERLRAVRRPQRLVVESSRVLHGLVGELWYANGMRRWAGAGDLKPANCRGIHVRLVVWGIEMLAVPASSFVSECGVKIHSRRGH
jgi:hypothetical protein